MQTIRSIETYGYKMNKDLVRKKDEIQCNKTIQKMINFDNVTKIHKRV